VASTLASSQDAGGQLGAVVGARGTVHVPQSSIQGRAVVVLPAIVSVGYQAHVLAGVGQHREVIVIGILDDLRGIIRIRWKDIRSAAADVVHEGLSIVAPVQ